MGRLYAGKESCRGQRTDQHMRRRGRKEHTVRGTGGKGEQSRWGTGEWEWGTKGTGGQARRIGGSEGTGGQGDR